MAEGIQSHQSSLHSKKDCICQVIIIPKRNEELWIQIFPRRDQGKGVLGGVVRFISSLTI